MYKKNIILSLFVLLFFSCNPFGGNKSIFKKEDSQTTHSNNHLNTSSEQEKIVGKDVKTISLLSHTFEFTAFKTPKKVGVKGTFKDIKLYNTLTNDTLTKAIKGSNFKINTKSIYTNDSTNTRDIKLNEFFFKNLSSPLISGSFNTFTKNKANVSITMNGVKKDFNFNYTETDSSLTLNGNIDIIKDFSANTAFNAIHKACKTLHEDKTWTEVNFTVKINK